MIRWTWTKLKISSKCLRSVYKFIRIRWNIKISFGTTIWRKKTKKHQRKLLNRNRKMKMNQYNYFVIFFYVISICDIRIKAQTDDHLTIHHLDLQRKFNKIEQGKRRFPAPKASGDVFELFFGVLLPEQLTSAGCTYKEALPAMELAIKKLQQPGGLFENYTICVEYRDTKSSSIHGAMAAFDLYTKQTQGSNSFFTLAPIAIYAKTHWAQREWFYFRNLQTSFLVQSNRTHWHKLHASLVFGKFHCWVRAALAKHLQTKIQWWIQWTG